MGAQKRLEVSAQGMLHYFRRRRCRLFDLSFSKPTKLVPPSVIGVPMTRATTGGAGACEVPPGRSRSGDTNPCQRRPPRRRSPCILHVTHPSRRWSDHGAGRTERSRLPQATHDASAPDDEAGLAAVDAILLLAAFGSQAAPVIPPSEEGAEKGGLMTDRARAGAPFRARLLDSWSSAAVEADGVHPPDGSACASRHHSRLPRWRRGRRRERPGQDVAADASRRPRSPRRRRDHHSGDRGTRHRRSQAASARSGWRSPGRPSARSERRRRRP